jgi:hypothetical protein
MSEPTVRFAVTCPHCGNEVIGEYPVAEVAVALLLKSTSFKLYAACHNHHWNASQQEMKQIRQFLGSRWSAQSDVPVAYTGEGIPGGS